MPRMRFEEFAINKTQKRVPTEADMDSYIGLEHLDSGTLTVSRWGSEVPIKGEKLVMKKGDVLLGKRNAYLRRAAVCPHDGLFSAHGMVLNPIESVMDPEFFPFFICSDYFFDEAIRISVGSLSPTINWRDLAKLEFNIPSLERQKELAGILQTMHQTKEAYRVLMDRTNELVKSQFIEMFGDGNYNKVLIGDIFSVRSSKRIYSKELITDGGVPFLKVADLIEMISTGCCHPKSFITEERYTELLAEGNVPRPGDILVTTRGTIGDCYIVKNEDRFYFQDGMISWLQPCDNNELSSEFAVSLFSTDEFVEEMNGASNKTTVLYISLDKLAGLHMLYPAKEQQEVYINFVQQSDKSKFELQRCIEKLNVLSKKIMADNLG